MRTNLRVGLATTQLTLGVVAVLLTAAALIYTTEPDESERAGNLLLGTGFGLGIGLLIVWAYARRRPWLRSVLAIICALLAAGGLVMATLMIRSARINPDAAIPIGALAAASATLAWAVIAVAAGWEGRFTTAIVETAEVEENSGDTLDPGRRRFETFGVVVVVVAAVTLLTAVAVVAVKPIMYGLNQVRTSSGTVAGSVRRSTLDGGARWSRTIDARDVVPTVAGLAAAVDDGVIMIDPATGKTLWSYGLRSVHQPPAIWPADAGSKIIVSWDDDQVVDGLDGYIALDARTGRNVGSWPTRFDGDDLASSDPALISHQVGLGSDSIVGMSATGGELWRYRPGRCIDMVADGTPSMILVLDQRSCANGSNTLVGLDPRNGRQRWQQPAPAPDSVDLTVAGLRLEYDGSQLRRRSLETGRIQWTSPAASLHCQRRTELLDSADGVNYLAGCRAAGADAIDVVQGYRAADGTPTWKTALPFPMESLTAVDDRQVLAITSGSACRLLVVGESGSRPLSAFQSRADASRCRASSVIRMGGAYFLNLQTGDEATTRLIALS
ncbi:PQQ-binding-like beta-propeller repeat protein [Microlunatus elymi]|uniref:PQQ-binding-like beta-propeller repeat protein n=1 Tax=Microlunatus elymi TaxID=2596828 RepID=A0A516PU55_9ACTN|nr:PQQ-binding-like beta-propeller repeat protein [Microlunatus elymi]QDP94660.1 PQQ-binding-like beta-propeller repeat protein [Microlunatus elymi]